MKYKEKLITPTTLTRYGQKLKIQLQQSSDQVLLVHEMQMNQRSDPI